MASDEMPWASGVLLGSGMLAACAQGTAARKIAMIDAQKGDLSFMPRFLSVRDRGVNFRKSHRFQSTLDNPFGIGRGTNPVFEPKLVFAQRQFFPPRFFQRSNENNPGGRKGLP